MKILYVITGLGLGGAEKVVVSLADQMVIRGHSVKIIYLKGDVLVKPLSSEVELIGLNFNGLIDFFSASKIYKDIVSNYCPDIIHSHMIHANIFSRINRIGCKVNKLICTAHNSNEGGKLRMLGYRITNFLSDVNTNVSMEATESLISKGAFNNKNLITVYNGIDLDKFKKVVNKRNNNEIKFISIGRFNEQKDYPNLLNAIALIKEVLNENVKFYIVGDGELRDDIENLISKLNIQKHIILMGKRSDIPMLLNDADFFILPSKHEGLPTVVIEAMACQTYVIATDCGGSAEIMGDTGKLVPIHDSKALSEAILHALSLDVEHIEINNINARQRIEDLFSLDTSIIKWLELYAA